MFGRPEPRHAHRSMSYCCGGSLLLEHQGFLEQCWKIKKTRKPAYLSSKSYKRRKNKDWERTGNKHIWIYIPNYGTYIMEQTLISVPTSVWPFWL